MVVLRVLIPQDGKRVEQWLVIQRDDAMADRPENSGKYAQPFASQAANGLQVQRSCHGCLSEADEEPLSREQQATLATGWREPPASRLAVA
jgi:hypothetical protein